MSFFGVAFGQRLGLLERAVGIGLLFGVSLRTVFCAVYRKLFAITTLCAVEFAERLDTLQRASDIGIVLDVSLRNDFCAV